MAQIATMRIRGLGADDTTGEFDQDNFNIDSLGFDNSNISTVSVEVPLPGQKEKEAYGDEDSGDSQ